ncbi:MAG: hypothetical protein LBI66_07835 [Burkholderiaceae bacterium]|jgi:hypothetical protein|nr:hypothetical protein [Burkholderiaceae bacterium]
MRAWWVAAALAGVVCGAGAQDVQAAQEGAVAVARSEDVREQAWQAYVARVARTLGRSQDARELAFATILGQMPDGRMPQEQAVPDQVMAWRQAALERAGGDRLAYQLLIDARPVPGNVVRGIAIDRWRALEPWNLAPLLYQALPAEQLMQAQRSATHTRMYWYDSLRWMHAALLRQPPTEAESRAFQPEGALDAEELAASTAAGIWAATMMPRYGVLLTACKLPALRETPERLADCRHAADVLTTHPSIVLEQMVGLALLREMAGDGEERASLQARRRRVQWQMHQFARLSVNDRAAPLMRQLADPSIQTEQQLLERTLLQAGLPLDPPPDWVP